MSNTNSTNKVLNFVALLSLGVLALFGTFYLGSLNGASNTEPKEIAASYYLVVTRALNLEPKNGEIHRVADLAMKDKKITYAEYGVILEKIEDFVDHQMNLEKEIGLQEARASLISNLGNSGRQATVSLAGQQVQQSNEGYQPQPAQTYYQPAPAVQPVASDEPDPEQVAPQPMASPRLQMSPMQQTGSAAQVQQQLR